MAERKRFTPRTIRPVLLDLARVASGMFDGELCRQIVTERAWNWMRDFDPNDIWSSHDNYDVEHGPFVAAKKTLIRLERLAPEGLKVAATLWVVVPTLEGRISAIVQNGGPARWQRFADQHHPIYPPMADALASGLVQEVEPGETGILTVLAPVRDSFKDVSGLIELSAAIRPAAIPW